MRTEVKPLGTYVLSICFLNFIAGFAAAMYMHNPRLFRLRRRKKNVGESEFREEGQHAFPAGDARGGQEAWVLPESWREELVLAKLATHACPETVLHGLLHFQYVYRHRMLEYERRLRAADEAERIDESLYPLLDRIKVANREFVMRLRESTKLIHALDFDGLHDLDDRIHDLIFDIEPYCDEKSAEEAARELKTSGVRNHVADLRRAVDAGHPFRDFVEMMIAERLYDAKELAGAPDSWLRHEPDSLRNRIGFAQSLDRFFESETEPFQICSFHLDRFRQINERIGVGEGDILLESFVALLRDLLPGEDNDQRMARLFGATVIVFLPKTDRNGAEVTAERVRQAIEASSIQLPGGPIECTISCAILEASERQSPAQIIERIGPIIKLINKCGGNRTGAENEGDPELIEPRAFQVEARVVRNGSVANATLEMSS